jgi:hypothetical protein
MIYTDGIHLIADTLPELHKFALSIGLKRHFFEGVKKRHPHYDLTNEKIKAKALQAGAERISSKEIVSILKEKYGKKEKKDKALQYGDRLLSRGNEYGKPKVAYIVSQDPGYDYMIKLSEKFPYTLGKDEHFFVHKDRLKKHWRHEREAEQLKLFK